MPNPCLQASSFSAITSGFRVDVKNQAIQNIRDKICDTKELTKMEKESRE
jgi:hypothetical protein